MQSQIISKNEVVNGDTLQTGQDGINSPLNSFQLKNILNSSRVQKSDQSTLTDQYICNCSCDMIPKLKQKAHKSFMQVIQIQTLYKEEIQELKNFYQESLKSKDKKFKIKQEVLNQRCKQLQQEIQKVKQQYQRERPYQLQTQIQSPFDLDNIDTIMQNPLPDDSSESIYNIRQFIAMPNLTDNANRLEVDINSIITELKKNKQKNILDGNANQAGSPKIDRNTIETQLTQSLQIQIRKIFQFISKMIDNTVQAHQKYNDLVQISNEAENRYTKLYSIHQTNQKQSKFMTEHIKRISQDKIRMQKKCNQLQRMNKALDQNVKFLKKVISEKQFTLPNQKIKKDQDCLSVHHFQDDDQIDISKGSLLYSNTARRAPGLAKSAQGTLNNDKILPRGLNFKKKVLATSQKNQQKV